MARHAPPVGLLKCWITVGGCANPLRLSSKEIIMKRLLAIAYGAIVYCFFLGTFLYAIGFVGNLAVPKTIDSKGAVSLTQALVIDVALLGLFAAQHSIMARPAFKRLWTQVVPQSLERATYVLFASAILA